MLKVLERLEVPEEVGGWGCGTGGQVTSRDRKWGGHRKSHCGLGYISLWRDTVSGLKGECISLAGIQASRTTSILELSPWHAGPAFWNGHTLLWEGLPMEQELVTP